MLREDPSCRGEILLVRMCKRLGPLWSFGRTLDAGQLRWVASEDLTVVTGTVTSRHPAFVAMDGLSVYGYIGAPMQG